MPDSLLISNAKEMTGLNINALIFGHSINYNFLQSLEGLNRKDRRILDGLTFLMAAGSLQIVFRYLSSEYGQVSQDVKRILAVAASALASGKLCIFQFEEIFSVIHSHRSYEIVKKMNGFIAERASCR